MQSVPGTAWSPPSSTTALPRSCWTVPCQAPFEASTQSCGTTPGTAQVGPRAHRDLRECQGCASEDTGTTHICHHWRGGNTSRTCSGKAPNFISVMKRLVFTYWVSCTRAFGSLMLQIDIFQVSNAVVYPLHCWR